MRAAAVRACNRPLAEVRLHARQIGICSGAISHLAYRLSSSRLASSSA